MLNVYLSTLPEKILSKTVITENRTSVPTKIDRDYLLANMSNEIESEELTPEKALYVASNKPNKQLKTIEELLFKGR